MQRSIPSLGCSSYSMILQLLSFSYCHVPTVIASQIPSHAYISMTVPSFQCTPSPLLPSLGACCTTCLKAYSRIAHNCKFQQYDENHVVLAYQNTQQFTHTAIEMNIMKSHGIYAYIGNKGCNGRALQGGCMWLLHAHCVSQKLDYLFAIILILVVINSFYQNFHILTVSSYAFPFFPSNQSLNVFLFYYFSTYICIYIYICNCIRAYLGNFIDIGS